MPGLFGGSEATAEQHLRKALTYNPRSTATLFFLSEVVAERGRTAEARTLLQQVLDPHRSRVGAGGSRLQEKAREPR